MKEFYRVIDFYEGDNEIICETSALIVAKAAALQRYEDTDGECDIEIYHILQTTHDNIIFEKCECLPRWAL